MLTGLGEPWSAAPSSRGPAPSSCTPAMESPAGLGRVRRARCCGGALLVLTLRTLTLPDKGAPPKEHLSDTKRTGNEPRPPSAPDPWGVPNQGTASAGSKAAPAWPQQVTRDETGRRTRHRAASANWGKSQPHPPRYLLVAHQLTDSRIEASFHAHEATSKTLGWLVPTVYPRIKVHGLNACTPEIHKGR